MLTKEKAKELNKIDRQIIRLMKQSFAECEKPPAKSIRMALKRCGKIIRLAIQMRMLEMQKRMILSQPIPKFKSGRYEGDPAIVAEVGPEMIFKPGGFQNLPVGANVHPLQKKLKEIKK